ncbi:hypothetical protein [Streptomyces apocyni]|uniref:hypothetical protein n=1 Tax=Streptomyces apocyni TaxID=2654677 RepID=UPI0012EADAF9|nr:hypothetical protein [Streptomyces apocyni]
MSPAPVLNSQLIGLAHYATVPLRERLLAPSRITFPQSIALGALVTGDGPVERGDLVDQLTAALKIDEAAARETLADLTAAGLADQPPGEDSRLRATDQGRALHEGFRAQVADLASRIYGDIPAADRETTARVLLLVTERANALAAE